MHLTLESYLRALREGSPAEVLYRRVHTHLLETCEVCAAEWQGGDGAPVVALPAARLRDPDPAEYDVPEAWLVTQHQVDRQKARRSRRREAARLARVDLTRLLRLPTERWRERVTGARTRYRSRALAELMIAECRQRVRSHPRQAVLLAELVSAVLAWTISRPELTWAPPLLLRAEAQRANALRVAGDLPAADGAFRALRADLARHPVEDPLLGAELDSLEASLRIGQRAFPEAEALLARAAAAYRRGADRDGEARTSIQLANLLQALGRPEEVLPHLDRAASLIDAEKEPFLYASTVTGRVNVLCDLDRAGEAARLLSLHAAAYADCGDAFIDHLYRFLRGRVALGAGGHAEAERHFQASRDAFLELGRDYDAILTSLYLADALLAAGKLAELRDLAAELVPLFRARGVARETLAALRLLAQAAAAETLTAAVLQDVRRRLEGAPAARPD